MLHAADVTRRREAQNTTEYNVDITKRRELLRGRSCATSHATKNFAALFLTVVCYSEYYHVTDMKVSLALLASSPLLLLASLLASPLLTSPRSSPRLVSSSPLVADHRCSCAHAASAAASACALCRAARAET